MTFQERFEAADARLPINRKKKLPKEFLCMISHELMEEPITFIGYAFCRRSLIEYMDSNSLNSMPHPRLRDMQISYQEVEKEPISINLKKLIEQFVLELEIEVDNESRIEQDSVIAQESQQESYINQLISFVPDIFAYFYPEPNTLEPSPLESSLLEPSAPEMEPCDLDRYFGIEQETKQESYINRQNLAAHSIFASRTDITAPVMRREPSAVRDVFFDPLEIKMFEFQSGEDSRGFHTAIINDDILTVNSMLNANPNLLLIELPKDFVIESQFTWQKFLLENENALSIAVKLKKIGRTNRPGIIETLLTHFDTLEQGLEEEFQNLDRVEETDKVISQKNRIIQDKAKLIEIKTEALGSWTDYDYRVREYFDEIVIPEEYSNYLQPLINIFAQETFPNQIVLNDNPDNIDYNYAHLSEPTEEALTGLLNKLIPEVPQKINEYPDVELLLSAAYKIYTENFDRFQNWQQRNAFCIRVIGLIQSVLSPESAKIFCQGLYDVVERNVQIGTQAEALKLHHWNGGLVDFYRSSRDSCAGLGGEYLCGGLARTGLQAGGMGWWGWLWGAGVADVLEKLCQTKATDFQNATRQRTQQPLQPQIVEQEHARGCCLIL